MLYANPGFATRINELPEEESARTLDEPRLIRRCQVMADRVFDPSFLPAGAPVAAPR